MIFEDVSSSKNVPISCRLNLIVLDGITFLIYSVHSSLDGGTLI